MVSLFSVLMYPLRFENCIDWNYTDYCGKSLFVCTQLDSKFLSSEITPIIVVSLFSFLIYSTCFEILQIGNHSDTFSKVLLVVDESINCLYYRTIVVMLMLKWSVLCSFCFMQREHLWMTHVIRYNLRIVLN